MGNWTDAILFGFGLVAFVLGVTSIIMGFIAQPVQQEDVMKSRVEYGFFGVSGVVLFLLFVYALTVG
ncbi:MAG: hypothetical protein CL578_19470 [Alteromonadaceae bacterium]|jgi:uncharacterized membrane protein YuzA (DUF378 family)|uniref:Uncharacterized protein n=3 Tax=Paraglaciecola TaxID=1621534 RepID=A0A8H9M2H3_9ALTE|nr:MULTISPECIES: hypothetical protein [Paraglaciecola]AEE21199.1 hypothetical protein Glaag_0230 [Glaciecola sp. 4H-3-7+YE-5]MBN27204.1 hypothetical protein [Alteromonadaceae bacterium]MBJ2138082.1 hypothetical protein [Paraglaciecola chathamensis]MBU3020110.1 hypothetical protein [Paraglaciecola agarilytica]MDO6839337.1 hypothetical protein [Paraglaciecola chathamensis]|tara:strand:- start:1327 stop:1527 length:201 start_codon:yes stop_codon:yes gene_type:complete